MCGGACLVLGWGGSVVKVALFRILTFRGLEEAIQFESLEIFKVTLCALSY